MALEQSIVEKLTAHFKPETLEVINDSHRHAGHTGDNGTGESHFTVAIVSAAFSGKSRLERHRLVNAALAAELQGGVHALAIKAYAPGEAVR
jgi:stress-induced morphogen